MAQKRGAAVGADLYRKGFDAVYDAAKPACDAAVAACDAAVAACDDERARESQAAVDAAYAALFPPKFCFRDSYNDSSLFWKLGLSWWGLGAAVAGCAGGRDEDGDGWDEDGDGYSSPAFSAKVLALVAAPGNLDRLKAIADPEERAYFVAKYDQLCHFLQAAVEAGDGIWYSV